VRESGTAEKVVLFVDNSEVYRALHLLEVTSKLDYRQLRDELVDGRIASQLRFYCGEVAGDQESRKGFYRVLGNAGFDVIAGSRFGSFNVVNAALDAALQRWIHCQIVYDMANLMSFGRFDTFILVSGGAEYAGVVEDIRRRGVNVEVAFFSKVCSRDLRESASKFREIDLSKCFLGDKEQDKGTRRGKDRDSQTDKCVPTV